MHTQGGTTGSLWGRAGRGFIRNFPSPAAMLSPSCRASLPPPADPPRAARWAVQCECSTHGAASPVCRLLNRAGLRSETFSSFLLWVLEILQSGVERSARPTQGWDPHVAGVGSPRAAPRRAGTWVHTARESGQWAWCWSPRRPGLGHRQAHPVSPRLPVSPPQVLPRIPVVP